MAEAESGGIDIFDPEHHHEGTHEGPHDDPHSKETPAEHEAHKKAEAARKAAREAKQAADKAERERLEKFQAELTKALENLKPQAAQPPAGTVNELMMQAPGRGATGFVQNYGKLNAEGIEYTNLPPNQVYAGFPQGGGGGAPAGGGGAPAGGGGGGGGAPAGGGGAPVAPPPAQPPQLNNNQLNFARRHWKAIGIGTGGVLILGVTALGLGLGLSSSGQDPVVVPTDDNNPPVAPDVTDDETVGTSGPSQISLDIWEGNPHVTDPDGADNLDKKSLVFEGHDENQKTTKTTLSGIWTYNKTTSKVIFNPASTFSGGKVSVQYTVADTDGERSNVATLTISYRHNQPVAQPPLAFDQAVSKQPAFNVPVTINVLDGTAGEKPKAGTSALAKNPVYLINKISMPLAGSLPQGAVASDYKSLIVQGEGVWRVLGKGKVQFEAYEGFHGAPTAIAYQLADTNGLLSKPAAVVINANLDEILNDFKTLNDMSDVAFWNLYKTELADPAKTIVDIGVFDSITFELERRVLDEMNAEDRTRVSNELAKFTDEVPNQLKRWTDAAEWEGKPEAAGSPAALFNMMSVITDANSGLGDIKNGTRAARLGQTHAVIEAYLKILASIKPSYL